MDALDKLDAVSAELEQAGAKIVTAVPLADPADPHVVVAHDLRVSSPTLEVHASATAILATHHVSTRGLIPWADPDIVEGEADASSID